MRLRRIGFTGTQDGMTVEQRMAVRDQVLVALKSTPAEFHHGDCVGADEEAFMDAEHLGYTTVAHPGPDGPKRAYTRSDIIHEPMEYLDRDLVIAQVCDELVAAPGGFVEQIRSGTWSTIRRARKEGKRVHIAWPDGSVTTEVPVDA